MKYYCINCGSELTTNNENPYYSCSVCDGALVKIPDYETPEQYERRTGNKINEKTAIYVKCKRMVSDICLKCKLPHRWKLANLQVLKENDYPENECNLYKVIASPPIPPPDYFFPEE